MSRSGYCDDVDDYWALIRWRGAVASATRGKRGQALLRELLADLDAMPDKKLIANDLQAEGAYCTLGVLGANRGIDMSNIDVEDNEEIADTFGIARALACEIMFHNDEGGHWQETPEHRWERMRRWVVSHLIDTSVSTG